MARKRKRGRNGNGGGKRTKYRGEFVHEAQRGYLRTGGFYGRYRSVGYVGATGELKFHDIAVDDASIAVNGVIQNTGSINLIPQGVTEVQRVGRKCVIRSINWRYNLQIAAQANLTSDETIRMIMYVDKQANGATATVTGILETDDYQSFRNLANSGRFNILYDKTHSLNASAGGGDGTANDAAPMNINRAFYKKCSIPLEFDSTTGAITEIRSNNIGILTVSKNGTVAVLDSRIRLRFSDGN